MADDQSNGRHTVMMCGSIVQNRLHFLLTVPSILILGESPRRLHDHSDAGYHAGHFNAVQKSTVFPSVERRQLTG